jgi:hypothetical protein
MKIVRLVLVLSIVGALMAATPAGAAPGTLPDPVPCDGCWMPPLETSWQIQFSGRLDRSLNVDMYEIDMFDSSRSVVADLHGDGRRVVCYVSAGSWERWRPDADGFPKSVLGKELDGWPGERWLDIREMSALKPLLRSRIELCKDKGFDGIEFDNVNGYRNRTGFPLDGNDQLEFNAWLANEAHRNGLSVALKNDGAQVRKLVDHFDWALVEQCFQYDECQPYTRFIDAGKPVMEIEYRLERSGFCSDAERIGFNAIRKHRDLDAWVRPCPR